MAYPGNAIAQSGLARPQKSVFGKVNLPDKIGHLKVSKITDGMEQNERLSKRKILFVTYRVNFAAFLCL
jgi:formylmethanofuran:tetrahydromethanopterin formyltransferase